MEFIPTPSLSYSPGMEFVPSTQPEDSFESEEVSLEISSFTDEGCWSLIFNSSTSCSEYEHQSLWCSSPLTYQPGMDFTPMKSHDRERMSIEIAWARDCGREWNGPIRTVRRIRPEALVYKKIHAPWLGIGKVIVHKKWPGEE